ncbi:hypothetical protein J1784_02610 [Rahnella sp. FRB 231]|uniref:Uncharacterized protein n=1 Tax=Rahnella ecdela TaxID=2816250 RepID=A0ABS6LAG6_9GAMM|nr:hypothetical protein [Rahnella ecdela]
MPAKTLSPSLNTGLTLLNKSNFWQKSGSDHHIPDSLAVSRSKKKFKITNRATYNWALVNRSSLTFWLGESAIPAWYDEPKTSSWVRPQRYSELAIFTLMKLPLRCPDYSCVSRGVIPSTSCLKPPRAAKLPIWLSIPPD